MLTIYRKAFGNLSESERCQLLKILGFLPCAVSGSLVGEVRLDPANWSKCSICHTTRRSLRDTRLPSKQDEQLSQECEAVLKCLEFLITTEASQRSNKTRILVAHAIQKVMNHISDPVYLNVKAVLGQWSLRSLQSSVRELRFAAA